MTKSPTLFHNIRGYDIRRCGPTLLRADHLGSVVNIGLLDIVELTRMLGARLDGNIVKGDLAACEAGTRLGDGIRGRHDRHFRPERPLEGVLAQPKRPRRRLPDIAEIRANVASEPLDAARTCHSPFEAGQITGSSAARMLARHRGPALTKFQ